EQYLNEIDRDHIALMEALVEPKMRVFVLPDGNERDKQKQAKDYTDGGNNVVKTIESLVNRGDVELAIFGILSRENIEKRSDEFFDELYLAFFKLALGMEMEGMLIRDDVRLYLEGNLNGLRKKGKAANRLADMIELVIAKTSAIAVPKLQVGFGIDYAPTTLGDRKVNMLLRTGMEKPNAFRSSGLDVNEEVVCVPLTDLWPSTDPQKLNRLVDKVKEDLPKRFSAHELQVITAIDDHRITNRRLALSIVGRDNLETTRGKIDSMIETNRELMARLKIYYLQDNVWVPLINPNTAAKNTILVYPSGRDMSMDVTRKYAFVVAPGQSDKFVFPRTTLLKYSTVIATENSIEGIRAGIIQGFEFVDTVPSLQGGQREIKKQAPSKTDWSEFNYLKAGKGGYEKLGHLQEYNKKADAFANRCVNWAKSRGITFDKPEQLRASLNYAYTCFFMTSYDNHPDWKMWDADAERLAMNSAMYMFVTYLWDDRVYDLEMNHQNKADELEFATGALIGAVGVGGNVADFRKDGERQTFNVVKSLVLMIRDLGTSLDQSTGSGKFSDRWRQKMANLIKSHHNEYFLKNNIPFENKRLQNVGEIAAMNGYVENRMAVADAPEKRLWTYIYGIEESIGASMTFEILMASLPGMDSMPKPVLKKFEDVFSMINIYYRLLNDAAEVFRPSYDKEGGDNAVTILLDRYEKDEQESKDVLLRTTVDVLRMSRELKAEILKLRKELLEESRGKAWERLAIAVVRSDIAELFYKNTHYRVAKRDRVSAFFQQMYNSGINDSK
ncbi:hypothetical protein IT411_03760, partial [Candidatus Peregrinibacteria bacterium]|nr:hypothetical protein [Candidatus Peregrinibacteria bacterium]